MNLILLCAITLLSPTFRGPDPTVVPNNFGVNIHEQEPNFNFAPGMPEQMYDMGFRSARIEISWADCQTRLDGPIHLEASDPVVQQAVNAGLRPLLLLTYNNLKLTGGVSPDTADKRAGFNRFVSACAERYKEFHPMYEVGNEPTHKFFWIPVPNVDNYTKVVIEASKAIKDIDPESYICAASLNPTDEEFLQSFINKGGLTWLDAISLHPYTTRQPESVIPFLRHVQALVKAQKLDHRVGVVSTEWGYANYPKWYTEKRMSSYYPRIFLCGMMAGLDLNIVYEWSDRGSPQFQFGVLDIADKPKPFYYLLKSMLAKLNGYQLSRFRADGPSHEYLMIFKKGSSTKTVGWMTGKDPDDIDETTSDPKAFEPDPVEIEFEGHHLTLTTIPKVFDF